MSKIKLEIVDDNHAQARACVDYVARMTRSALERAEHINPTDHELVAGSIHALNHHFADLERVISHLAPSTPLPAALYEIVGKLILGSFTAGTASVYTPEAKQWNGEMKALSMRKARRESPQEEALRSAIEEQIGTLVVPHPNKEASAILQAVNDKLKSAGFAAVKVDVVRRRIEKRSAILKSAANNAPRA